MSSDPRARQTDVRPSQRAVCPLQDSLAHVLTLPTGTMASGQPCLCFDIAFFIADPILMTNMQWCWTLKCLRCSTSSGRKGWVSIWAKRLLKRCRPSVCLLLCHVFSESSMKLSHSVFHFTQPAACPSLFGPSVISHCGLSRKHRLGAFAMMKQSRHGCCPSIKLLLVTHLLLASCVLCILTMAITVAYMFSS